MMEGRLIIDGIDAWREWGVYVTAGGWNELLAYPPLKSYESNDWYEDDGIEADLSAPQLASHEAQLRVASHKGYAGLREIISMLSAGVYHIFNARSIDRVWRLRLVSVGAIDPASATATLRVADDFALTAYQYAEPGAELAAATDYLLDDTPFTAYGARVLRGSLAGLAKSPAVKSAMKCDVSTLPGINYDADGIPRFKSYDARLYLLMRAPTLARLWRQYDALLYDLTRPGERMLGVEALSSTLPCCYKSASVTDFYPTGKIWLRFSITLTILRPPYGNS